MVMRLLAVGLMLGAVAGQASDLVLVVDGKPNAVILVEAEPARPAPAESAVDAKQTGPRKSEPALSKNQEAALALQKYLEKMSGATLPIVEEGRTLEDAPAVRILVGHTTAARELGVVIPSGFDPSIRPEAFEEEGFVLATRENNLIVAGNNDGPYQGTIYAAYALLERLGCRFYFPGEWGEVVPERKTITVPNLNVVSRPDFAVRSIWLSGWVPVTKEESAIYYQDWALKVGFNRNRGEGMYPFGSDGSLGALLPPAEYFETHPEFYAMGQDGQRHAAQSASHTMLCLSNPEVFAESVKNLQQAFAGERKMGYVTANGFGISPPDGTPYCYCTNCKAASQNFNYPAYVHRTSQSEEFFRFAADLGREFPDKWVGTMAYSLRLMPPQGVVIPSNMTVTIAPISCCVFHPNTHPSCWRRLEFTKMLAQWRRITPHVIIYDYNPGFLLGMWVPERDVANFTANIPVYKKIGIKGFNAEGRKAFMQTWLSYYVRAKLLWNAQTDVAALKKEFYTLFFGPEAGPHVQAWWDACEDALLSSTAHVHEDWLVNHLYTAEFVAGIRKHVDAALAAKASDVQHSRVEAFALIADHLAAYAAMNDAESRLDYPAAAQACQRMTDCKNKLNAIYSFFISVKQSENPPGHFAEGRKLHYEDLAARLDGSKGRRVAELPLYIKFTRDRFNEGVIDEWYAPDHDDSGWGMKNTYLTWDQQDPPEDAKGHDYDGYGWYRASFECDKAFAGRPIRLYLGGVINEGWVWVNGLYAGHKSYKLWWGGPHFVDLDVTGLVRPGERNTVAIRVWNDAEIGGLYRRGFLYSPAEPQAVPAETE